MIVAIILISISFLGAVFAMKRLYRNTKLVVVMLSALVEFFGGE